MNLYQEPYINEIVYVYLEIVMVSVLLQCILFYLTLVEQKVLS